MGKVNSNAPILTHVLLFKVSAGLRGLSVTACPCESTQKSHSSTVIGPACQTIVAIEVQSSGLGELPTFSE